MSHVPLSLKFAYNGEMQKNLGNERGIAQLLSLFLETFLHPSNFNSLIIIWLFPEG